AHAVVFMWSSSINDEIFARLSQAAQRGSEPASCAGLTITLSAGLEKTVHDSSSDRELPVEVGGPVVVDRGEEREAGSLQVQRGLVELELRRNPALEGNSGPVERALRHGLDRVGILDALSC